MLTIPLLVEPDREVRDGGDVLVDAVVDGRPYRFRLDTGAARTELVADDYLAALPASGQHFSGGVFGQRESSDVVTVSRLSTGELSAGPLEVVRTAAAAGRQSLLGMDLLGRYCCQFRFADKLLVLTDSPVVAAGLELRLDAGQHVYLTLGWAGVTASTCWDSGAGISVVDRAFAAAHAGLFAPAGNSAGTDATLAESATPLLTMVGPHIAGAQFRPSTVAVVDLGPMNNGLEIPVELIAGFPLLRQADWLFDFPARRFAAPQLRAQV